jgi:hypothetical protein
MKIVFMIMGTVLVATSFGKHQIVTSPFDSVDGSLRSIVTASAPKDTVVFNVPGNDTIVLKNKIDISKEIVIDGENSVTGQRTVIKVDTPSISRFIVFAVTNEKVSLLRLSMLGGNGGVIRISGANARVFIDNCVVKNGRNYSGGGISNNSGHLTLLNSTVSNNGASGSSSSNGSVQAVACGGGVFNDTGVALLENCTIDSNYASSSSSSSSVTAGFAASVACGGGIYNGCGRMTIINCTIAGNSCFSSASSSMYFYSYANSYGGGVYNESGTLAIVNSTVNGNTCNASSSASPGYLASAATHGDEVYSSEKSSVILNSILYNVQGTCSGSGSAKRYPDSIGRMIKVVSVDNVLANNGGPTQTIAVDSASPAFETGFRTATYLKDTVILGKQDTILKVAYFDSSNWHTIEDDSIIPAGTNILQITNDQRGVLRRNPPCIGAFECALGGNSVRYGSNVTDQSPEVLINIHDFCFQIFSRTPATINVFDLLGNKLIPKSYTIMAGKSSIAFPCMSKKWLVFRIVTRKSIITKKMLLGF